MRTQEPQSTLSRVLGNQTRFRGRISCRELDYGLALAICLSGPARRYAIRFPFRHLTVRRIFAYRNALAEIDKQVMRRYPAKGVIRLAKKKHKGKKGC
jgi:hypothetical protein